MSGANDQFGNGNSGFPMPPQNPPNPGNNYAPLPPNGYNQPPMNQGFNAPLLPNSGNPNFVVNTNNNGMGQNQFPLMAGGPKIVGSSASIMMACPHCHHSDSTRVQSDFNWLKVIAIILVGPMLCFIPFCFLCSDSVLVFSHFCRRCGSLVAKSE